MKKSSFFPFIFNKKKDTLPKNFLPKVRTKVLPGPKSAKLNEQLKRFECPQITYMGGVFPVYFKKAMNANIIDVDGNRYLDLTSCFGVANIGHSSPAVLRALNDQSKEMMHGMGDIHPNEVKVSLAKKLSEITPGNLNQTIFSSTGSEAVESAIKSAVMFTKKTGIIAFEGAYHGLGYGALSLTHREDFRKPFLKQLGGFSYFASFPDVRVYGSKAAQLVMKSVASIVKKARRSKHPVGAVILEPILGRGGIISAPPDFLKLLRAFCDEEKILMIADEVFTGFGRTGSMFAMDKSQMVPDLMCLGKGMGNGFPISACIGTTKVMYGWGSSTGEAIHTSTFLGNPLGCAIALAAIKEIEDKKLVDRSKNLGDFFRKELWKLKDKHSLIGDIRGAGLMIGIELIQNQPYGSRQKKNIPATEKAKQFVAEALGHGLVLLLAGPAQNVISITPPFILSEKEISYSVGIFDKILQKIGAA